MAEATLCIVGFPTNAYERELHNLCRWSAGFQDARVVRGSTLFVKFLARKYAMSALEALNGVPFDIQDPSVVLKVEFARREMELTHPVSQSSERSLRPSNKRSGDWSAKQQGTNDELRTITVQGLRGKGLTSDQLEDWFAQLRGYVGLQYSHSSDAVFIKFDSAENAGDAVNEANDSNDMGAEWARRNLEEDPDARPSSHSARLQDDSGSHRKRQRVSSDNAPWSMDTICVLGMSGKTLEWDDLEQWFRARRGFIALNASEKVDGIFVKFVSAALAERAMEAANSEPRCYGAEWARRSLDVDMDSAPSKQQAGGFAAKSSGSSDKSELDTLVVLGLQSKGLKQDKLQQWFHRCPGFLKLQANDRHDAVFVKFDTPKLANEALNDANRIGFGAEWARRNLELD